MYSCSRMCGTQVLLSGLVLNATPNTLSGLGSYPTLSLSLSLSFLLLLLVIADDVGGDKSGIGMYANTSAPVPSCLYNVNQPVYSIM